MNNRNPTTSQSLGKLLDFLRERGSRGASTWEIMDHCQMLSPATCISELRHSGHDVLCKRDGTSELGKKIYKYYLL